MAQLPHNLREILVLRGVEKLSQTEAAAALGISDKAVETRLYRARAQLKKLLSETFVTDSGYSTWHISPDAASRSETHHDAITRRTEVFKCCA